MVTSKKLQSKKAARIATQDAKPQMCVLVGTYKREPDQLKWIGKRHLYNYPLSAEEAQQPNAGWSKVKELWLYSGPKDKRHIYAAEFVGIKSRKDFLAEHPDYPKSSGKGHGDAYAVFSVKFKYQPTLDDSVAVVRVRDFAKRTPKIAKAIEAYKNGESLGCLLDCLPAELAPLPHDQLCVCEAAVQLRFWDLPNMEAIKPPVPFPAPEHPKFTFIDLFAGIGGFRIAMQRCGGKCVFTSEFDSAAQKTYEANFGEVPAGDITKQETHDLIPLNFDIVCAGFPCQAFSLAGKRLGFQDLYKGMSRGTLFAEVVKICERHRPKAVFCENIKGLYIHDKGNTFKVIKNEFESIGYRFFYKVLNSKDFGVPQHRERIYMVAFRDDYAEDGYVFEFPEPAGVVTMTLNDIRERNVSAKYYLSDVYVETLRRHRARHEAAGHGFGYVIRDWNGVSGAIVCGGMGRETNLVQEENGTPEGLMPVTHIHGSINKEGIRKMTPREWARLQGFPEEFKLVLSDVHLYKQFGNSVSIPVIEAITRSIIARIGVVDSGKPKRKESSRVR